MTGDIVLPGNPAEELGAVPAQYVDLGFAGVLVYNGTAWAARPATVGTVLWIGTVQPPAGAGGFVNGDIWISSGNSGGSSVTLDTTATDIQPLSTQTAGSTGKAADAGHIHDWVLIPTGVKTAGYTAAVHDMVRVNASSSAITITLPNGPADRTVIGVKIVTAGHTCTVAAAGTDVFTAGGGATTYPLNRTETALFQYVSVNKVWLPLAHSQSIPFPAASAVFKPANPTGTASTAGVMMGLGGTIAFTPAGSGIVKVTLTTLMQITAGAAGAVTTGGRYGTGTAPSNAATISGTTFGPATDPQVRVNTAAAGPGTPLTITDRLTLTVGTAYWFDLAVTSPASGDTCVPGSIVVVIEELVA